MTLIVSVEWLAENTWNPNVMDPEVFKALKVDVEAGDYNPVDVSPMNVYYGDPELPSDRYVIVDGKHRWAAAVEAGVGSIEINVKPMTEAEAKGYNYRKNRERGAMDPIREAALFQSEIDVGLTQEEIAEKYIISRAYVSNRLRLLNVAEPVRQLYRDPEEGLRALKKEELAADIVASNPEIDDPLLEQMVEETLEEKDLAPRGAITASHMEAIAGLTEDVQKQVATSIIEDNLTVRATETVVRLHNEKIARRARFEVSLEGAVQETCPECGAPPGDFERLHTWGEDEGPLFNEDKFSCSKTRWHDWDYMKKAPSKERQLAKERKERSEKLSKAKLNPRYIRREEERDELIESMRPWVLRKIKELDEIGEVNIEGLKGDKVVSINFLKGYSILNVSIGDSDPGEHRDRFYGINNKSFGFDIEKKNYKKLPFNSKLDLSQPPSPENRAMVHYFLDHIIDTNLDPFLPEAKDILQDILRKYGEAPEEEAEG